MFILFILILSFIYSTTYFSHVKFILKHYIFYKYFDKYILSMVFEGYILNLCMPKFIYSVCYYWSVCKEIKRSVLKEIRPEYSWKDWCWSWTSITLTTWCKELTHWKRPWRQEEKGTTEDEMVRWHHRFDGREYEKAPGVGDGQWSLICCSPLGLKESDMTKSLNWTELLTMKVIFLCHRNAYFYHTQSLR